jgi:transcriptional pleiotropic regulator of transition state genes
MKATGIVRRIDHLGRVVLPKELRRTMDINEDDPMEIFTEDGTIILKPYAVKCKCGASDDLLHVGDIHICKKCALAVADAVMEA